MVNTQECTLRGMCIIRKLGMPCRALMLFATGMYQRVEFLQLQGIHVGRKSWVVGGNLGVVTFFLRLKSDRGLPLRKKETAALGRRKNGPQVSQEGCLLFHKQGSPQHPPESRTSRLQTPEHLLPVS